MDNSKKSIILAVDDDRDALNLIKLILEKNNYRVITANSGAKGLEVLAENKPDIILLDVMMPEMDGYEFCTTLQGNSETSFIPVIFVTALGEERNKAKALSVGGVDYLVKPINKKQLLEKIRLHLKTNERWENLHHDFRKSTVMIMASDFIQFKEFLSNQLRLPSDKRYKLARATHSNIYSIPPEIGINNNQMAKYIADFLELPYRAFINPDAIELGILPAPFCRANRVLVVKENAVKRAFVVSNPFNIELTDIVDKLRKPYNKPLKLVITPPENIETLLKTEISDESVEPLMDVILSKNKDKITKKTEEKIITKPSAEDIEKYPIMSIANSILRTAVTDRASDIHIEPKKINTSVRFRVDGDMKEMFTLKKKTGIMLISRLKVIGNLDIAEKRKPQDGTLEAVINNRTFKLRLATTSTPGGESLIIRFLEPSAKPKTPCELGMTSEQSKTMLDIINRDHGLILIVGPTGSGKTTTIYSLLSQIDCKIRSLVSIEDPVEYRIPHANQQQVNEKAGVTFDALVKSVVRQDPDIIYLGEIRDQYSAKMSLNFASTGHLTITTLHTSNTTTAIFRLERLGITRDIMAEAILCIIAQRLMKKLCPHCKEVAPITNEEKNMLSPFTDEIPSQLAHPIGCSKCNNTGYWGREGFYEILTFDPKIAEMVRSGAPIGEIRNFVRERGTYLVSNHAIEKVKNLTFSAKDVYQKVLVEDMEFSSNISKEKKQDIVIQEEKIDKRPSILVVDDDKEIHALIKALLENRGYNITSAQDGVDALISLSKNDYDLIISDVNMPNLDGFKLLEIKNQKGIKTPVIFLTSRTEVEDEIKGLELGAIDYIKKPVKKKVLLLRINNFFEKHN